ncbi:hypothetical protein [Halosimplex sp. TS25]|uniref:hypothetical protein n=1 Tax=Halosimplex rarum TaxID=3396619 RepID=UPI0039ECCED0
MTHEIAPPTTASSVIECDVTPPDRLRRFFTGERFRVEYDVDVSDVPPSISVIPALAQVCPVAWANGADVSVPVVDARFLRALEEVRDALVEMYPAFMEGGEIRAEKVVDTRRERDPASFEGEGLLFSGGVDSVASYVRTRDADPTLVSVQGWVIGDDQDERWENVRGQIARFADEHGVEDRYVRSNMLSFLDTRMLQAHYQRYVDGAWYSSVGHGLGLLGLTAPLAYKLGLGTVHMAATHTEEFAEPWGSHPKIDNRVRWGHTECHHDGYELSRQEKLELIADYVRSEDVDLTLRTCTESDAGANCNECEKCYRTMCGLLLAGLDPNDFGYETSPETFEAIRSGFERGAFTMGADERFMWRDVQGHIDLDQAFPVAGATEFFRWLSTADVDSFVADSNPPVHHDVLQALARNVPYPVYAALAPVYEKGAAKASGN